MKIYIGFRVWIVFAVMAILFKGADIYNEIESRRQLYYQLERREGPVQFRANPDLLPERYPAERTEHWWNT